MISLALVLLAGWRGGALTEAILEATGHVPEVLHAACAWSTAAVCLDGPVVATHLLVRKSTGCTPLLLNMEGPLAATGTQHVCLLVPLAHSWSAIATTKEKWWDKECGTVLHIGICQWAALTQDLACEWESHVVWACQWWANPLNGLIPEHLQGSNVSIQSAHEDLHPSNQALQASTSNHLSPISGLGLRSKVNTWVLVVHCAMPTQAATEESLRHSNNSTSKPKLANNVVNQFCFLSFAPSLVLLLLHSSSTPTCKHPPLTWQIAGPWRWRWSSADLGKCWGMRSYGPIEYTALVHILSHISRSCLSMVWAVILGDNRC